VLPGLTGNIGDSYINNMAYELLQAGHQVIVYNYRLLSITHVMDEKKIDLVEDLHLVLQLIKKRNPDKILFGVGHSYGANQLVNYLGRHGE
jgi:abhydrolase domain-containing protein 1/3